MSQSPCPLRSLETRTNMPEKQLNLYRLLIKLKQSNSKKYLKIFMKNEKYILNERKSAFIALFMNEII